MQQYQFWTLIDYPDLTIAHALKVPPRSPAAHDETAADAAASDAVVGRAATSDTTADRQGADVRAELLSTADLINLRGDWDGDALQIAREPDGPWRRFGLLTRDAVAVPCRVSLLVSPIAELGLFLGRLPLVPEEWDAATVALAPDAWTRVRIEIEPTICNSACHSDRSATSGSTRIARLAGM